MAIVSPGSLLQNVGNVSSQFDRLRHALMTKAWYSAAINGTTRIDGRGGVWPQVNALNVTASGTPDMNVHVDRGGGLLPGTQNTAQGNYPFFNDSGTTVAIAPSNTQQRIDSVVAHVKDAVYSGVSNLAEFISIAGTPGSGSPPNLASLDNNYTEVARVTVRANTTNVLNTDIQMVPHYLTAPGGVTPVQSYELTDPGAYVGDMRIRVPAAQGPNGTLEYWGNDGKWHGTSPYAVSTAWANGTSNIAVSTSARTNLITATISDPGWPYFLEVAGQINFSGYGAFSAGSAPYCQGFITYDTNSGTMIAQSNGFAQSANGTLDAYTEIPTFRTTGAALTGAHTVVLSALSSVALNVTYTGFSSVATYLYVKVLPV